MSRTSAFRASLLVLGLSSIGCGSSSTKASPPAKDDPHSHATPDGGLEIDDTWLAENTIALRHLVSVPDASAQLRASELVKQLQTYDPGSLLRCAVQDDPAYRAVVDELGGVTWGYAVSFLEDESKPRILLGPELLLPSVAGVEAAGSVAVQIEKADIVGLSESAALFYSKSHGLMLIDLSQATPRFVCAAKLPGQIKDFYYYQEHLVAMDGASLLHFKVDQGTLQFLERVKLDGQVLDTRRFNDKLVVYESLDTTAPTQTGTATSGAGTSFAARYQSPVGPRDRALEVFTFGDTLKEELHESLINTSADNAYLINGGVAAGTLPGTVVHTGSTFGDVLWASDHYFVVTEAREITTLSSWVTNSYQVCSKSHSVERTFRSCQTLYETKPNPDYVPPDNSGGDRACKGQTLADCLRAVAKVSNPTIDVPTGIKCSDQTIEDWVCDSYVTQTYTYPEFEQHTDTRLTIFEYTDGGFVRLAPTVHEITTPGLSDLGLSDAVSTLTTSDQAYDLSVPGRLQTLYFQNGFLYAVADGVLQTYAMGDSSLVRTSSLQVVGDMLQTSLFSDRELYLSDYGYDSQGANHSTLRVIDLSNGAFPKQVSQDYQLPGGNSDIFPTSSGILTVGQVQNFDGISGFALKVGLLADPFTTEKAYLILGTDLVNPTSILTGDPDAMYFDANETRLFVPYTGSDRADETLIRARVGVSHVQGDQIVTEGAVHLAEAVDRVRPRPGKLDELLSFGQNSIAWLTPGKTEWQGTTVLSYYTPIALYRVSDADDYVEVLRLGSSCKLHFAKASQLDVRDAASLSEAFDCGGYDYVWAYRHDLVFSTTTGVRFQDDGTIELLDAKTIADLESKRQQRLTCIYSRTPTNQTLDYANPPPSSQLECLSPDAYAKLMQGQF